MFLFSLECRETDVIDEGISLTMSCCKSKNRSTVIMMLLKWSTYKFSDNMLQSSSDVSFFCIHVCML